MTDTARNVFAIAAGGLLLAAPLIIRTLSPLQNFDDACYIQFAAAVARGEMPYRDFTLTQLPAVELLLGALYRVTGPNLPLTAGITACLIWGTAFLIWKIGVRLGDRTVGLIAALLWTYAPPVIAHHFFEREFFTTIIMVGMLYLEVAAQEGQAGQAGQATDKYLSGRMRLMLLVALSTLGILVKFTFIFAIAGFALSMALQHRRRGLLYLASCAASAVIALGILVRIMSTELIWQALIFQSMKGSTPLLERFTVFSIAVGPWAVLAIAGILATADQKQWRLVTILAVFTSVPFVLLGPTYWSHNTIDPVAMFALLGGVMLPIYHTLTPMRARLQIGGVTPFAAKWQIGRVTTFVAAVMLFSLIGRGQLEFVTEGISKVELSVVSAEIDHLSSPHEPIIAPSPVLISANRSTPIVHPEYLGVYRWIRANVAEQGLWSAWREATRRGFYENRRMEKWRWEDDVYREITQGRVRVVVTENSPFSAPENSLNPARLLAAGLRAGMTTERYRVWSR